jgi:hypothetical protein
MTVLQLRHENVSNPALCSSDLLLIIASPQSGQCRMGRPQRRGHCGNSLAAICLARAFAVSPVQCGGKNAESGRDKHDHNGLCWHRIYSFVHRGSTMLENQIEVLILIKFWTGGRRVNLGQRSADWIALRNRRSRR